MTDKTTPIFVDDISQLEIHSNTFINEAATLRDQFAMAALTGLITIQLPSNTMEALTTDVYLIADAMMEARKL